MGNGATKEKGMGMGKGQGIGCSSIPSPLSLSLSRRRSCPIPHSLFPLLRINLTQHTDGSTVLKCTRADGTSTWQKQQGKHAAFFALHDLTHFAVESELGIRDGFYGLIAKGWSIEDTEGKGPRGPLPHDALFVENVVGTLDSERASGSRWTAEEFNENTARFAAKGGRPAPRALTDDELASVRKRRAELFAEWNELAAGGTMELRFG
jgi:hypothetical protein